MVKLLTHFGPRSNRVRDLQNPNAILNPDNPQQQHHHEEDNAGDGDDVSGTRAQTASSIETRKGDGGDRDVTPGRHVFQTTASCGIWTNDDDEDRVVSGYGELQTASTSESRADEEDVVGDGELHTTSTSERRTEVSSLDEEVKAEAAFVRLRKASSEAEQKKRMEAPPSDDCCPICFGNFYVPCRGPCGHWYCGGCILQYWNFTAALQPCNCPMCSRKITKLMPEGSLYQQQESEVLEILKNVKKYNRLFVGGTYGLILKVFELPLYIKRIFSEMMNPDRPGAHLNKLRIFAMLLGFLYSVGPFDFLRIGRHNVVDLFDHSAILLSLILYGYGIYLRRRRFHRVRELAEIQLD